MSEGLAALLIEQLFLGRGKYTDGLHSPRRCLRFRRQHHNIVLLLQVVDAFCRECAASPKTVAPRSNNSNVMPHGVRHDVAVVAAADLYLVWVIFTRG